MRKSLRIFSLLIVLLGCTASLRTVAQSVVSKKISQEFAVSNETRVEVKNTFGLIHVTSWDKKVVEVEAEIIASSEWSSRAKAMLNEIDVDFDQSPVALRITSDVDIKTKGEEKFEINYSIKAPRSNAMKLANSFGDIFIDDRDQPVDIELAYGDLKAGKLMAGGRIEVAFGNGNISHYASGKMSLRYCDFFSIGSSESMELDQQFSEVRVEKVHILDLRSRYGEVEIGQVNDIRANLQFSNFVIGSLSGQLEANAKYVSNFTINNVEASFSLIDISGDFGSYNIDLDENLSAIFEGQFRNARMTSSGVDIDFSLKSEDEEKKEYKAKIGKGDSSKRIIIYSSYGDLRLTQ